MFLERAQLGALTVAHAYVGENAEPLGVLCQAESWIFGSRSQDSWDDKTLVPHCSANRAPRLACCSVKVHGRRVLLMARELQYRVI